MPCSIKTSESFKITFSIVLQETSISFKMEVEAITNDTTVAPPSVEERLEVNSRKKQSQACNPFLNFLKTSFQVILQNSDDFFLVVMGIIIIFMQAGFGFLEAGSIRAKNTTNILIKNYADLCAGGVSFWLCGYSFAFGTHNVAVGLDYFLLAELPREDFAFFFFQVISFRTVQIGIWEHCMTNNQKSF